MTTMIETLNQPVFRGESPRAITRANVMISPTTVFFPNIALDDSAAYEAEKWAFEWLLPSLEDQYSGKYVAIHRGSVVDSDECRADLVRRFFKSRGDTHVYIGYVGHLTPVAHQLTPFRF